MSSNSPSMKRHSLDRPASSLSYGQNFLRPSSAAHYGSGRRRLSDNNFHRTSVTSQTSSLHTALSELAGDVEVVDMEDGALTNDRYSHNDYPGIIYFLLFFSIFRSFVKRNFNENGCVPAAVAAVVVVVSYFYWTSRTPDGASPDGGYRISCRYLNNNDPGSDGNLITSSRLLLSHAVRIFACST